MKQVINVTGLGYIGLPTALMLAAKGNNVVGTDCNKELIEKLEAGTIPFSEAGMERLFFDAKKCGIIFEEENVKAQIYIVAVPTPYEKQQKKIDPSYVVNAVKSILTVCPQKAIIAIESTVAPGTIDRFVRPLMRERSDVCLAHVPERIIPGSMIWELQNNSRTIGADDKDTANRLKEVYQSFCRGEIVLTDIKTAEMTKVVENTYRDINIAYANELTKIARRAGLDVYEMIRIANKHPRVNILSPGPGVGGHCISVDPWFLVGDYPGLANIILAARKINDSMPEFVLKRVSEIAEQHEIESLGRVGFYGLTYKENVDDVRESPTLQLISFMKKHMAIGAHFYDPFVKEQIVKGQMFDLDEFLKLSDMVVIMVGHDEIVKEQEKLKGKIVYDTRHVLSDTDAYHL
ncbi:MAG: nucleotide sugar dehydrogenase [Lachnospiraceae bacterium]|nr:nucleotide sugar dehydrogenase [Lachnospiraceae bacterium]